MTNPIPTALPRRRSQAWFPGRYVPIRHLHGAEIFTEPRGGVQVNRTTLTGTAAELRSLSAQLLRAANRLDQTKPVRRQPEPVVQPAAA